MQKLKNSKRPFKKYYENGRSRNMIKTHPLPSPFFLFGATPQDFANNACVCVSVCVYVFLQTIPDAAKK